MVAAVPHVVVNGKHESLLPASADTTSDPPTSPLPSEEDREEEANISIGRVSAISTEEGATDMNHPLPALSPPGTAAALQDPVPHLTTLTQVSQPPHMPSLTGFVCVI